MRNQKPYSPNPIRRFREHLRLSREEFCGLIDIPLDTLRSWEREKGAVMPREQALDGLIKLAKKNTYPLTETEVRGYIARAQRKPRRGKLHQAYAKVSERSRE